MSVRVILNAIVLIAAFASNMLLSACGAWQAVSTTTAGAYRTLFYKQIHAVNIDLAARASINPDEANRPCSVVVRVYQLKDRKLFDAASYGDLLKHDKSWLAEDLLASTSAVLTPGAAASLSQPLETDTHYVAIVALYREPDPDGRWRKVLARSALSASAPLQFELIDRQLVATGEPKKTQTD